MVKNRISLAACAFIVALTAMVTACPLRADIIATGDYQPDPFSWWNSNGYLGYSDGSTGELRIDSGSVLDNVGPSSYPYHTVTLGYGFSSNGSVTVTDVGSTWEYSGLTIGYRGTGSLTIQDGATVSCPSVSGSVSVIGGAAGSTGTAIVTGVDSTWTNGGFLVVGESGNGALTVQNGGDVSSRDGRIASESGSQGRVTVTGGGSTWMNENSLFVGYLGTGTLTVADGGVVRTRTLYAQPADLYGNGSIYAKGLVSDIDMTFDSTHGPFQHFSFGSGGDLFLDITGSAGDSTIGVGYKGVGRLTVAEGVEVRSLYGYLGYAKGSTGIATVEGTGSSWRNGGGLCVGFYGNGELTVCGGGNLRSSFSDIGYQSGSNGTVTVTGAGSTWLNGHDLSVGNGTLTVSDGGVVSTETLYARPTDLFGNGVINTEGLVSDVDLVFDSANGQHKQFVFGAGGILYLDVTGGSGEIGVGYKGVGHMTIAEGVTLRSRNGYLGYAAGSNGTAMVNGAGSTWTNMGSLLVGYSGDGALTIKDGGNVSNFSCTIASQGGSGRITVTGIGSTLKNSGGLTVGALGSGILSIADGGKVTASNLNVYNRGVSQINLRVSGNDMLVLGTSTAAGRITNYGKVNLYADAFLAGGTYTPISDSLGRAMAWSGTGTYNAFGGTWNSTTHEFTVAAATNAAAGSTQSISDYQRLIFTDGGRQVGMSFGDVDAGATASASYMTAGDLAGLSLLAGESVLSAWNFTVSGFGSEVLLSYNIGLGASDLEIWHYDGATWTSYSTDSLVYDSNGIASFTVTGFSGYAITGTPVPEPATMGLLTIGAAVLLRRRMKK